MLDDKLEILLNEFQDKKYHTALELSTKINLSEKTVRLRIKELNEFLMANGGMIKSKPKLGYWLEISDRYKFNDIFKQIETHKEKIPSISSERVPYILAYLLNREDYIKVEDLSDFLYISRNTLSADLKKVEYILNVYHLSLERRPNYGIKVVGKEFDKRICIANNLIKRNFMRKGSKMQQELQTIGDFVLEVIHKRKIRLSEVSLNSLITHIYIAIRRIRRQSTLSIDNEKIETLVGEQTIEATREMISMIEDKMDVLFEKDEISYIALHLGAKTTSNSYKKYGSNIVISGEIDELALQMLDIVYRGFKIDFRDNLELRMSLNQHMVPLDIRLQYDIPLKNPLLGDIKKEYAFAYTIAATACIALNEHYHTNITEDEIGYFAMIFGLALEKQDKKIEKKNIVIVCASGKGTTQLFMYKYKQAFGKYINNIYECTAYELETFNFEEKNIHYVFTTIPINLQLPVPIFEVNMFLEHSDIAAYSELFEMGSNEFLNNYYKKELFLTDIAATSKADILTSICEHTKKYFNIPDDFYEAVMKREQLGQTDFGNLAAIPHPFHAITKENFVSVGILKEPIWWGHNEVQVVFLVAISTEADADADIERFYQLTTKFLFDADSIQYLIEHPSFEVLMTLLSAGIQKN